MSKQWDDWRCYRCNKWQPSSTPRTEHLTPSGMTFSVCPACATQDRTDEDEVPSGMEPEQ